MSSSSMASKVFSDALEEFSRVLGVRSAKGGGELSRHRLVQKARPAMLRPFHHRFEVLPGLVEPIEGLV